MLATVESKKSWRKGRERQIQVKKEYSGFDKSLDERDNTNGEQEGKEERGTLREKDLCMCFPFRPTCSSTNYFSRS